MKAKTIQFNVKVLIDPDDKNSETKEVSLMVKTPTLAQTQTAQLYYNKQLQLYISKDSQAPLRAQVSRLLEEKGIKVEDREVQAQDLRKELDKEVASLYAGGIRLLDGRKKALKIRELRAKLVNLNFERNLLEGMTAEAQAEQDRFNWFVAHCTVYSDTGTLFFVPDNDETKDNLSAYLVQQNEPYARDCARKFGILQYGLDPDYEKKFEENQWLIKFKFARESDCRLIDRNKHLVDADFNLIDEDGFLVNANDDRVNTAGVAFDKDGKAKVESIPYLDDNGNPITE